MESPSPGVLKSPATRVVLRVAAYYAILVAAGWLVLDLMPATSGFGAFGLEPLLKEGAEPTKTAATPLTADPARATAVAVAMISAILLSIPVAWVYQLTRAKRGYQQSVVQLMIILPLVVSGVVILVKDSLALAFSLAGIVAAVRFRNSLDDSKDAVYVFLATGLGLAAAVDIPVATVISLLFNLSILMLWYTDFGNSPVELEGRIAARRLRRAKELARTGTFVAQIDNEVFKNMSREQLEGLAQRALRRAHDDGSKTDAVPQMETCIRIRSSDMTATRRKFEVVIGDFA